MNTNKNYIESICYEGEEDGIRVADNDDNFSKVSIHFKLETHSVNVLN